MPRKLCWIEVDEEGKAVGPIEYSGHSALVQRNVIDALPDAAEEVVEAVAKQIVQTADECNICIHRHEADADATALLTRLASAPPTPERR